jgi:hypothetical protein
MSRKWSSIVGTAALAAALLVPSAAMAQRHDRDFHHPRAHWGFSVGVGPGPYYGPAYANGFYDAWGVWHPYGYYGGPYAYGYYDRWGHWHRR